MSANATTHFPNQTNSFPTPRAFEAIVYGGLAVGVLDILDAITFFGWYRQMTAVGVLQSVAGGLYGREAFNGGAKTAVLGLCLHFLNATLFATAFYLFSRFLPVLTRHPVISGMLYGVAAYLVMTYIVVPHSAYGPRTRPIPWPIHVNGFVGHALLVGLPISLIASWSAKRRNRPRS
jgi:uncharacterized membrane protein YagU involved in acid resistance